MFGYLLLIAFPLFLVKPFNYRIHFFASIPFLLWTLMDCNRWNYLAFPYPPFNHSSSAAFIINDNFLLCYKQALKCLEIRKLVNNLPAYVIVLGNSIPLFICLDMKHNKM